jgi:hypothetical protein
MKRIPRALAALAPALLLLPASASADPSPTLKIASRITAATVYTDRAMVTRMATVTLSPGLQQVTLEGLPPLLQDQSVRVSATGSAHAKILEVKVGRKFLDTLTTARVKPLLQKSRSLSYDIRRLSDRLQVLNHRRGFLEKITIASQESIARELKTQRPAVEDYRKLLAFFDSELSSLILETRRVEDEKLEVQQSFDAVQREIREAGGSPDRSEKEITVLFEVSRGGSLGIEASYLLTGAGWTPAYDIRAGSGDSTVSLAYFASVRQNTGEEWKDVRLTLTTSRPGSGGSPGELLPWYVGAAERAVGALEGFVRDAGTGEPLPGASVTIAGTSVAAMTDANGFYRLANLKPGPCDVRARFIGYTSTRVSTSVRPYVLTQLDFSLSAAAVETAEVVIQADRLEVQTNKTRAVAIRGGRAEEAAEPEAAVPVAVQTATVSTAVTAASFTIPGETTIPSDNADHRVAVMVAPLAATFSHTGIPKLQKDVFFRASMRNTTDYPILPGPMSVFLDNGFVATSKLPAVLPGETFDAFLGVDNGVRVERKLLNRLTEVSGLFSKTRKVSYSLLITAENQKKAAVTLSLKENVPVSQDERVKVAVISPLPGELLPDANGIITWSLHLAPGQKKEISLQYSVEAPVEMAVGGLE